MCGSCYQESCTNGVGLGRANGRGGGRSIGARKLLFFCFFLRLCS